jgi:chromosome segregation ATPase
MQEVAMSEQWAATASDDLKQTLNQQIDAARGKLDALKKDLATVHQEDADLLREKQEEIRGRLERQKDRARKLQSDIANWRQERVSHTKEAIASWRQRREIEKLNVRAQRAEDFAVRMVNLAAIDFEEAEQAVLDAVAARFDAELAEVTSSRR